MTLQIGAPLNRGFDQPLGLLGDCHRRVERFALEDDVLFPAAARLLTDAPPAEIGREMAARRGL
jgi:hypothetical protein